MMYVSSESPYDYPKNDDNVSFQGLMKFAPTK